MDANFYYVLHLVSGFLLIALTFQAFAAPTPERRKKNLMYSGIAGFVMLVAGFGLLAKLEYSFSGWVIGKLVCWLILMALGGIAFRRSEAAGRLSLIATIVITVAVWLVYYKPF